MRDECNSKHKLARIPVYQLDKTPHKRVRAFYPYATTDPKIEIGLKLRNKEKHWDD